MKEINYDSEKPEGIVFVERCKDSRVLNLAYLTHLVSVILREPPNPNVTICENVRINIIGEDSDYDMTNDYDDHGEDNYYDMTNDRTQMTKN